ncbi:acetate/propionate family kinase [Nakamurella lactea]|uniref:acetate/propionate family kinase n=1 Tax=Nakamurella lactea TaxID=459515 RepID=UPI0004249835|nr:acetate kinase [Nakamurella lactea]
MTADSVLVLNSGSSSMKYQLLQPDSGDVAASGVVERIGQQQGSATHRSPGGTKQWAGPVPDYSAALDVVVQLFAESGSPIADQNLLAVGHRVVHGGSDFGDPVIVDDAVLQRIRQLSVLAPLHNPANAQGIERAARAFPDTPQVAVFDTAFFRTLPAAAASYAIDTAVAAAYQVRRYGFHGTSHEYVSGLAASVLGRPPADLNQIVLHLGNGASVSAIRGGVAVETSMGMTPLEGLVMGTRSGDIDPGALLHLQRAAGLDVAALDELLNRRSGVLGLAGVVDMRDLHARIAAGNPEAELALEVYCHRARKYVGAYLAVLGRLDAVVFTAGVGENDARVRAGILQGLHGLGITVDPDRNHSPAHGPRVISAVGSAVEVLVVPTNEELAIARKAAALVR